MTLKKLLLAASLAGVTAAAAFAQTTPAPSPAPAPAPMPPATAPMPPATSDGNTPAVSTPNSVNPTAPVEGANSFTEAQAKDRIAKAGYTDVTGLALDEKGVWRGKAMKGGQSVNVALDYQGNVVVN